MIEDEVDSFGNPYDWGDITHIDKKPQDETINCPKCNSTDFKTFFSDCVSGYVAWYRAQCQECKTIVEWGYGEG